MENNILGVDISKKTFDVAIGKEVQKDVKRHISYLDKLIEKNQQQIHHHIDNNPDLKHKKELLESIPGIGEVTISVILSEFADISRFDSAKHLTSFLGIAPKHRQSGTSV